ncbi:MAG: [citrate (pro-3S)-lyase] ligase [Christensenellaceae bacterium]|nr:[citrate (pro-3S)-lyase] ligase [Christensenellaceae bacterium]MEA5065535.1 [citrate (pro-3S)-lyase] ligase [Eubacteriales bacterium]MEA5069029.1 [citrate (pro-3S)-lyase] ligase [Christensenellaceae bacterium]
MSDYHLSVIRPSDTRAQRALTALLQREGISRDRNLDYTVGLFDDGMRLVATGSTFGNTLRCLAVDGEHRGEGLLAQVLTSLIERQVERGYGESFLYTKPETARFFADLGFYEIERVPGKLVFMTDRPRAFEAYLAALRRNAPLSGRAAAVVMNANPFTLGHLHLLEKASRENDVVHVFVVSEEMSLVPGPVRFKLVREGSAHLPNVLCHPSGSYIVSSATFPSYFLKDDETVTRTQAELDIRVFGHIARALSIARRYVGEEPFSGITRIYNDAMIELLPAFGVEPIIVPRVKANGVAISASRVRQLIHDGPVEAIRPLVPLPTYAFFTSEEGRPVVEAIRASDRVIHD